LTNPAGVQSIVLGVAEEGLMSMMAEVLKILGTKFALVVHSDGLDEISLTGITKICELKNDQITEKQLNPRDFGIEPADIDQMKVGDAKTSAGIIKDILNGKELGPCRDIIVLNSAAAIIAGGLAENFSSAIKLAAASIDEGKALSCLERLIEISNKAQNN
jgi:anthranilate phosphoribosyltransferase